MCVLLQEAWLISGDVADKQLKDLEKTAIRLMKTPNKEILVTTPTPTPTPSSSSYPTPTPDNVILEISLIRTAC
jgi:hypothetical protein